MIPKTPVHSPHVRYAITAFLTALLIAVVLVTASFFVFRLLTTGL